MRSDRSPNVQRQAILAHRHRIASVDVGELRFGLEACRPELDRLFYACPPRHRTGRFPASRASWWQRIRNALEYIQFAFNLSLYLARGGVYDRGLFAIE